MVRTRQSGSVLSFVVVAIILVGLLVAGAYAVRRLTDQSSTAQSPPAPAPSSNGSTSQSSNANSNQSSSTGVSAGSQPSDTSVSGSPTSSMASQLPHTGPEDVLGTMIALGMLSATLVAYVRSRRLEIQL